jgi:TRAP-type C4-dicarboxylate transport system substrate-binding protein
MVARFIAAQVLIAMALAASTADAATTLKIGTLAPQESPWGKEFKKWANEVAADTHGEVQLDFQWNAQAGDEVLMVQKIRTGQLDGAAVTAVGLGQTGVTDALIFQTPGLFANWARLDAARDGLKDELNRQFDAKGFTVVGWGDVGAAKPLTVGFEVHHPIDLQGKSCFFISGDPVQPKVFSAIGGITPRQLTVPEVLPALTSGSVNVIVAPPLAAEQLQWASRVTNVSALTVAFAIGAVVLSSPRVQALPPPLRDALMARGAAMTDRLTHSIRNLDAQAFARMKASKTVSEPSDAERREWHDLFARVAAQLRGPVFTPAVFDRVVQLAGPPPQ